jgi:hypothetical protein
MASTSRALTGGERSATQGNRVAYYRLEATNPDWDPATPNVGWLNVGALTVNGTPPKNFLNTAQIAKSIDDNTLSLTATVRREIGNLSLAPLRTDSPLNARASFLYAPALDIRRRWRIKVAVMPWGVKPSEANYRPLAEGFITRLVINGERLGQVGTITLSGRGMEMPLLKTEMLAEVTYAGAVIEARLQAMADRWNAGVTVYPDPATAPSYFVNAATAAAPQPKGNLMAALQEIAQLPGAVLRYMYDASDVNRFMLFTPNRAPTVPDWTLGPREYKEVPLTAIDLDPVRNYIEGTYQDDTLGAIVTLSSPAPEPTTVSAVAGAATFSASPGATIADGAKIVVDGVAYDVSAYDAGAGTATLSGAPTFSGRPWVTSASITRYGLLPFTLSLAQTTNVTTQTQMGALLDAIRSDWEFPAVEWQIETEGGWFFELYDYLELEPNGTHHDTAQFAGVTTVTHTFAGGKLMTTLGLRGKPAGGYRSWLSFGSNAPRAPIVPVLDQFNASWYDPPPPATTAGVLYSGYFGQYCRSVFVEIFEDAAYTTLREDRVYDLLGDGSPFIDTWVLPDQVADRNKTYYLRATPYSGPV